MSLGPGKRGEIQVKSPFVMLGYANNSEATAAAITQDGWMNTGNVLKQHGSFVSQDSTV